MDDCIEIKGFYLDVNGDEVSISQGDYSANNPSGINCITLSMNEIPLLVYFLKEAFNKNSKERKAFNQKDIQEK